MKNRGSKIGQEEPQTIKQISWSLNQLNGKIWNKDYPLQKSHLILSRNDQAPVVPPCSDIDCGLLRKSLPSTRTKAQEDGEGTTEKGCQPLALSVAEQQLLS